MKVIITGCAGMIGSYLTSSLLEDYSNLNDFKIIGIDNLSRGKIENLQEACGDNFKKLEFIKCDLTKYEEFWASKFKETDVLIHLADIVAGIGYVFDNESYVFRTNLLINSNVSKCIAKFRPKRYIYVGTACSFPRNLQLSINADPLKEDDQFPASPESGYGWSKLMGEIEASLLSKEGITKTVVLSLHNVYGKYCDFSEKTSQVIPSLCLKAIKSAKEKTRFEIWGDGSQGRAFVHALDVVEAIKSSFKFGADKGVIQIGPNHCTSINNLASEILNKVDKDIKIHHNLDQPVGDIGRCADYSKAKKLLNWEPKVKIEDGLKDLINWLKKKI